MRRTSLELVHKLARSDPRVIYIGSDLGAGTLDAMRDEFPDRFFMEGISEANIIGMAAGLAMDGFIPYVNTIATFLTRRCLEQNAIDLCLHNLPVRLIANGGGLVYAPLGPTHTATEDIALMRALPGMTIIAPCDADEMRRVMSLTLEVPGPVYLRLGKGGDPVVSRDEPGLEIGKAIAFGEPGPPVVLVTTGIMLSRCLDAAEMLAAEGTPAQVLHCHTVKPLDEDAVLAASRSCRLVVSVEEHSRIGGLGSAVGEALLDNLDHSEMPALLRLALLDAFPERYGSQDDHLKHAGLQADQITARVQDRISRLPT